MTMMTKIKAPTIKARAKQLLEFARDEAQKGKSAAELFLVTFGSQGKARKLFHTKAEWAALERTDEIKAIHKLIESATKTPVNDGIANGEVRVTLPLPKSVHAALRAEAAAEGVSLDQLCLSKLVAQLRELV